MMTMIPILETQLGKLYQTDCLAMMASIDDGTVDLAFADPPFNLKKIYASKIDDDLAENDYLEWCKQWLNQMVRVLRPGGALFLWNIPKWNLSLGHFLSKKLNFRHWITVDIKYSLPIQTRLYPSHYSLLYFIKGKRPAIFHPDRLPVPCCRHCGGELPDYGGYKDKMNPKGVSLTDVWTDIPPVRHAKYKKREANALPLKLLDRIISLASDPGSLVLDPFGGSGTSYIAAELSGRRWIGSELHCDDILSRFATIESDREHLQQIHMNKNRLFTQADLRRRIKSGNPISPKYRLEGTSDCVCATNVAQEDLFSQQ